MIPEAQKLFETVCEEVSRLQNEVVRLTRLDSIQHAAGGIFDRLDKIERAHKLLDGQHSDGLSSIGVHFTRVEARQEKVEAALVKLEAQPKPELDFESERSMTPEEEQQLLMSMLTNRDAETPAEPDSLQTQRAAAVSDIMKTSPYAEGAPAFRTQGDPEASPFGVGAYEIGDQQQGAQTQENEAKGRQQAQYAQYAEQAKSYRDSLEIARAEAFARAMDQYLAAQPTKTGPVPYRGAAPPPWTGRKQ